MARRLRIVGLLAILAGCSRERACKDGTVLVVLTLGGVTAAADGLRVEVKVDDGEPVVSSLTRVPGRGADTLEVGFPRGYPAGRRVAIAVAALSQGAAVGSGVTESAVDGGCERIALLVSEVAEGAEVPGRILPGAGQQPGAPDARVDSADRPGDAPIALPADAAVPDRSIADLAVVGDAGVDAAGERAVDAPRPPVDTPPPAPDAPPPAPDVASGCRGNGDCPSARPICASSACVACTLPSHCPAARPHCATNNTCVGCRSSADCSDYSGRSVCDVGQGLCVACQSNQQCAAKGPARAVCNVMTGNCVACLANVGCAVGSYCDPTFTCCPNGQVCS